MEIALNGIDSKIETLRNTEEISNPRFIEGLSELIPSLDTLLDTTSQDSEIDDSFLQLQYMILFSWKLAKSCVPRMTTRDKNGIAI